MKTKAKTYAVITCDIVGSRHIEEFRRKRDQKLHHIAKLHMAKKWILSEYAITAWDEFEVILSRPTNLPAVILDLRRQFHPFELWIGIGIGQVTEPYRKPVNVYAGGEAFERAREAMNHLKSKRSKAGALTSFVTGNETFDLIANTVYHLHDTLLESISIKQWQTIKIHMETNRQDLTAKKLGLNESTVSRNLRRGFWWQIHETRQAMERVIEVYFPGARQRCNFIGLHINMQPFMKLFLTVLLAHLMGDFPLQTASMVRAKQQGARAYIAHGAVHLLVFILCVAAFV